jgi:precorrin-6B methylase 2
MVCCWGLRSLSQLYTETEKLPRRKEVTSMKIMIPVALVFSLSACHQAAQPSVPTSTKTEQVPPVKTSAESLGYEQKTASQDGTGKFYMGREISQVMGYQGAVWLERDEREQEEQPAKVVEALRLKPTDVVVDLGAGTGYFSFRMSPLVPQGKVIAVDVQPEMIKLLEDNKKTKKITNVEAVLGTETDPKLAANSVDVVLLVDVYHELLYPKEVMQHVFTALKPGGRLVLIEYRGEDPSVPIKPLHKTTQVQLKRELAAVGLPWKETKDFLPQQHFIVFEKP